MIPPGTRVVDISPVVHPGIAVWPGDVSFARDVAVSFATGGNLDLSSVRTTLHVGAHADAPCHYTRGGAPIEDRPLERYLGPCQVVEVDVPRGERVKPEHVADAIIAPRVLVRTGSFPDPDRWNNDFCSLSPELVSWLAGHGVVLVGIDTPSVDPMDSKTLESHQALAVHDLAVLEGLVLAHVAPGLYTLVALPLRLAGCDASPVRAVLLV